MSGLKSIVDRLNYFKHVTVTEIVPALFGVTVILVFPVAFLLTLHFILFRYVVIVLAKLFRPDLGEILNAFSSGLVTDYFENSQPRSNVVSSMILEKTINEEEFKKRFWDNWIRGIDKQNGQLLYPQFQQYPVKWLGFAFYKHAFDTFDLDNHIHFHKHIGNGEHATEQDITNFSEKLLNSPFKPKTSLWEMHVVHNYVDPKISDEKEMWVMILKLHHSLADGFSTLKAIVQGICGQNLKNLSMSKEMVPNKRNILKTTAFLLTAPFSVAYYFSLFWSHYLRNSPWLVPDTKKTWHQHISKSDLIPLETIFSIKNTFKVTFTSVIVSAISAAAHKTMNNWKNASLQTKQTKSIIMFSTLPLPGHKKNLTNHTTGTFANISVADFPTPLDRLRHSDINFNAAKSSPVPFTFSLVVSYIGNLIMPITSFVSKNRCASIGLSNFPGIGLGVDVCGRKCLSMDVVIGCQPGDAGVAVLVFRYQDHIRISVAAEKAVMSSKEVSKFVEYMTDEIDILYKHVVSQ